jgi:hypothetical protein
LRQTRKFLGRPIESSNTSRTFELIWNNYIAYAVTNESFALADAAEIFCRQTFSNLLTVAFFEHIARATIATEGYPGPSQHIGVICLDHIIDVVSTTPPTITRLRRDFGTANLD